jgi:hypothetical protein
MTMADLRDRFTRTDDLPAPDLWLDIERKVSAPSRRAPNDTLRRLVTIAAAFAIAIMAGALLLRAFDRGQEVPIGPAPSSHEVTFWFDFDGVAPRHDRLYVDGVPIEGTTSNGPSHVYRYEFEPMIDVAAGTPIVIETTGDLDVVRAWIDACCDASEPRQRLYELDLANPSMPSDPGTYFVEFTLTDAPPGGPEEAYTFLYPVRVVATEGDEGS